MSQQTFNIEVAAPAIGSYTLAVPNLDYNVKGYVAQLTATTLVGVGQTLDAKFQDSLDGANWVDVKAFTQQVGGAGTTERKAWGLYDASPAVTAAMMRLVYVVAVADDAVTFTVLLEAIH